MKEIIIFDPKGKEVARCICFSPLFLTALMLLQTRGYRIQTVKDAKAPDIRDREWHSVQGD